MAKTKNKSTKTNKTTYKKKAVVKNFAHGRVYIKATFNNTIVTITDPKGNVLCWTSAGSVGFKGSKKSTPFAATNTMARALENSKKYGIKRLSVFINGPGIGRDAVLRFLRGNSRDFEIEMISDITPIPHNGPRPSKQRRG